ncbi:hypothetical protein [Haloarcula argentinensis]|uniref:Uncharacterized protein n=1 Tax=Haloarcula argentinensis TaxID=43776 RepID=A0A847UQY6_HALAR|nr:hypothetical protein [Haloarcula argentinensis]NLV15276.1 hypothetical protein [Haloarcula argentinensis]
MTRNLAHNEQSSADIPAIEDTIDREKELLNRRSNLQLGTAAIATALSTGGLTGATASSSTEQTHATNSSVYSQ